MWPLTLVGLSVGLRALTAAVTRQRTKRCPTYAGFGTANDHHRPTSRVVALALWWTALERADDRPKGDLPDSGGGPMAKPIVVIGTGIGGLSTAIRLAAAGRRGHYF